MQSPHTAQDFIRALKASSDPPHPGGPLKIEIARKAWDDADLYVPNKAEALVDWILSRLLKDKSKPPSENPVCDPRYWQLLADILTNISSASSVDHGRALRTWLVPMLSRIPIAPIVLSYLELLSKADHLDTALSKLVFRCISILWPLAVPKVNPETLLECFGAVIQLGVSMSPDAPPTSCDRLRALGDLRALSAIVSSYRTSLSNSAAKKKLYAVFLKRYMPCWLCLVACGCDTHDGNLASFVSSVYDAGIDTMFGLDIIKHPADHKHDTALSDALLEAASKTYTGSLLRCLPRLFDSYVANIKRYKSALFSQGSNQAPGHITEQLQRAAMTFLASCTTLARSQSGDLSWRCRVQLLQVVQKENLLSPTDDDGKALLREDGHLAVEMLGNASDESHASLIDSAVTVLATLTRIDYDLMVPSFAVIFPRLSAISSVVTPASDYLKLLLEYESKTRNLPSTIRHISDAFAVQHLRGIPGGPDMVYHATSAGPLTSLPFQDELSRAVLGFITPGQVLDTIRDVSSNLKDAYARVLEHDEKRLADRGDGPRKKRKKDKKDTLHPPGDRSELEYYAVSFGQRARTLVVVLRSLPLHTLTDALRLEAERMVGEVYSEVAVRPLVDGFATPERRESRAWQLVVTGALRLHYGLARAPGLSLAVALDDDLSSAMLACVSSEGTMPELSVEIIRTLLYQCHIGALDSETVLDELLAYLEVNLTPDYVSWKGKTHVLEDHHLGGVAMLHMLLDRWLPSFDAWATPKQLQRLTRILVNASPQRDLSQVKSGLTIQDLLARMLHNAEFWELLHLRDTFLARLQDQTSSLEGVDLSEVLSYMDEDSPSPKAHGLVQVLPVYAILLVTPPEYLPRAMHVEFLKRGFTADCLASRELRSGKTSKVTEDDLVVIRDVLCRIIAYLGSVENLLDDAFMDYLLEQNAHSPALVATTMNLLDIYQGSLIRTGKRGESGTMAELVKRYIKAYDQKSEIAIRASLLFIDALVQILSSSNLSQQVTISLHELREGMLVFSKPQLAPDVLVQDAPIDSLALDVWYHVQVLSRWLKDQDKPLPAIGRQLTGRLLRWRGGKDALEALAPIMLSILMSELQSGDEASDMQSAEYMIVAYISLGRLCTANGMTSLESRISSACRTLPVKTFSQLLDLVYESLPLHKGLAVEDISNLIRFSTVILHDAPEGTSKTSQAHATRCLHLFADVQSFTTIPVLRSEVLNFLVRQCSDKPATLRFVDLSSLWSILRALLSGSQEHEHSTDPSVFHGVVSVLNALVRLRRDLILNTLPHLGFVLRALVRCLRSVRPQLGGKQRRLVMDALPRWIAPTEPLGAQESKALARLLTTLTTKTMVRVHGPGPGQGQAAEGQKPESLVRPFSKHAAYVLTAYIELVNDPLCVLSLGVRRELLPGLFALCDMLGEHNRDAMMVSALDAGGKATMKALWREYEKQRYVGKG